MVLPSYFLSLNKLITIQYFIKHWLTSFSKHSDLMELKRDRLDLWPNTLQNRSLSPSSLTLVPNQDAREVMSIVSPMFHSQTKKSPARHDRNHQMDKLSRNITRSIIMTINIRKISPCLQYKNNNTILTDQTNTFSLYFFLHPYLTIVFET